MNSYQKRKQEIERLHIRMKALEELCVSMTKEHPYRAVMLERYLRLPAHNEPPLREFFKDVDKIVK